mgnify:CR=1 FL=1
MSVRRSCRCGSSASSVGQYSACIALGGFLENTVYRIAKWDEVDFCNQSLGAVLAGLGSLAAGGYGRGTLAALVMILWAVVLMIGGYHFAFR